MNKHRLIENNFRLSAVGFIAFCLLSFFSCDFNDDDTDYGFGEYIEELVISLGDNYYLTDSGQVLYEGLSSGQKEKYIADTRVCLMYSFLDKEAVDEERKIKIHASYPITLGYLRPYNIEEINQMENDPIHLQSIWVSGHYLNMTFYMNFHSRPHTVALACNQNTADDQTIDVYFRHSIGDDSLGAPLKSLLSFDLETLLNSPQGKRNLRININTSNYGNKLYELIY